jgi:hypothetical protein
MPDQISATFLNGQRDRFAMAVNNNLAKPKAGEIVCARCHRLIHLGEDVVCVERGVVGPRGVVPLGDAKHFCGESCLTRFYYDNGSIPTRPRRVP